MVTVDPRTLEYTRGFLAAPGAPLPAAGELRALIESAVVAGDATARPGQFEPLPEPGLPGLAGAVAVRCVRAGDIEQVSVLIRSEPAALFELTIRREAGARKVFGSCFYPGTEDGVDPTGYSYSARSETLMWTFTRRGIHYQVMTHRAAPASGWQGRCMEQIEAGEWVLAHEGLTCIGTRTSPLEPNGDGMSFTARERALVQVHDGSAFRSAQSAFDALVPMMRQQDGAGAEQTPDSRLRC